MTCLGCRRHLTVRMLHATDPLRKQTEATMLWTLTVLLLLLWVVGLLTAHTLGGFIHILLVLALIVLVARMIQGRRVKRVSNPRGDIT
jgi:hypothetical protein